jgi:hypothetical protein
VVRTVAFIIIVITIAVGVLVFANPDDAPARADVGAELGGAGAPATVVAVARRRARR